MATELGAAYISVGLSTKGLGGDLKKSIGGQLESAGDAAGKSSGKRFGLGFVGMAASALGALGVGSFFKGAVSEASGLGESLNALNVVYGKNSDGIAKLGKSAATSLGLSNLEFNNLAVRFSSFAQTISGPGGNVVGTLDDLTTRASDFASVMNLEVADAAQLFQSGLAGESEPLRQYGIDLSAAAVEAFALDKGIATSAASMTEAQKVQARYGLLMEKTKQTAGDFANTSNSLANQQRILSSSWKNAQATLGTALLPAMSAVTGALISGLGPAVAGTQKGITEITGGFRAFGAAFKAADGDVTSSGLPGLMERIAYAAVRIVNTGKTIWAGFKMPPEVAASIGPNINPLLVLGQSIQKAFGAIQPQIAALVPQLFALFQALSPTSLIFQALLPVLPQIATAISSLIGAILPLILSLASQLIPIITQLVAAILPPLIGMFGEVAQAIVPLAMIIIGLLVPTIKALMPVVVTVFTVIASVVKAAMQIIQGVIQVVTGAIRGNWSQVWAGIQNIFAGVWNTIKAIVSGAIQVVRAYISAGMGAISGTVSGMLGNIGRFFADTWRNVTGGVSGFIGTLIGFFTSLPGRIMGALSGAGTWLVNSGKAVIQGFIDGISSMVGAIGDAVGGVLDFAKSFFPQSPAKRGPFSGRGYTTYSGTALVNDFAKSISAGQGVVALAASDVMSAASLGGASYGTGSGSALSLRAVGGTGGDVVINGNVGWDPHRVAQEIEVNKRRAQTMAGMGGVVFA